MHCPLSNNIPDWLKLTAEGRLEEAYEVASATNNFPEICGRICPQDRLCGLLIYGTPNFKLDQAIVLRRQALMEASGIMFRLNAEIGRDVSFAEVRARYAAVLVATGVYQPREIGGPGVELPGIVPALADGSLDARGKHVVVIGGGDTAMDCVRTAVRQGAASVKCLYRRDKANMPARCARCSMPRRRGSSSCGSPHPRHSSAARTPTGARLWQGYWRCGCGSSSLGMAEHSGTQQTASIEGEPRPFTPQSLALKCR